MPRSPNLHPTRGQASADYVGLLCLVAVVVTVAVAGITAPPLAGQLLGAVRHGICLVGGGICTPREARAAGLEACVVQLRSEAERVGAVVAVVRLARGDTAVVERRSDGTAVVSFLDDHRLGAQTGVGLQYPGLGAKGTATAAGGISFATGRSHEFGSWTAAARFLARYAGEETTAGEGRDLARGLSPLHQRRELPAPRSRSYALGTWADLEAELSGSLPRLGARANATADARLGQLVGRRTSGRQTTWYFAVDAGVAARLGVVVGAVGGAAEAETVLEVTSEGGRLVSASVSDVAAVSGELSLYGHTTDLGRLADRLRRASAGAAGAGQGGLTMRASVALDLTVAENHDAVLGALDVLRLRAAPGTWVERFDRLGARLDSHGRVDLAVYRSATRSREQSTELSLGVAIGLERVRTDTTRELIAAWTAQGGNLREREDCANPAGAPPAPLASRPWRDPSSSSPSRSASA